MKPVNPYQVQPVKSLLYLILYIIFIYSFTMLPFPALINFTEQKVSSTSNSFFLITNIAIAFTGLILFRNHFIISKKNMTKLGAQSFIWIGAFYITYSLCAQLPLQYETHQNELMLISMSNTLTVNQIPFYLLVLIVAGPLMNTLIYQEILVNQLSSYLPKYVLAILSAMLYSSAHIISIQHWISSIPFFLMMFMVNILFIKSKGNLWFPLFGQMLNNLILLTMVLI